MIPETFVGNPGLEAEYLASLLLGGLILPSDYTSLRVNMASIPMIDAADKLSSKLQILLDEVVTKYGLLDDKVMKDFYFGNAPELKSLVKSILKEVTKQIDLYKIAAQQQFEVTANIIEQQANTMDYYNLAEGVSQAQIENEKVIQYNDMHIKLRTMSGVLGAILTTYGMGEGKLPTKKVTTPGVNTGYKLYLQNLSTHIDEAVSHMKLSFTIAKALDGIFSLMPKNDLDPYLTDVCNNYIEVVTNPKSYYKMCQNDEIVSSSVGTLFGNAFPEFYNKFQDMYMEDYNSMDNQEQIEFRKCFGLDSDESSLTSLCSQYVKLGFTQQ